MITYSKKALLRTFCYATALSILVVSNGLSAQNIVVRQDSISIEYPEVYELANIILALTDYGITDKWQVRKDFAYYDEMRAYFKPWEGHPLLDSANFSRERWEEYLSFRTDAYAFSLDENYKLHRNSDFHAFEIRAFDKFQTLIEDFARQTSFKSFFKAHSAYYQQIADGYKNSYLLPQMSAFLKGQFGDFFANRKYAIVLSPFVYAQNLHRDIDETLTADFPPVSKAIINGTGFANPEEKSNDIHGLFTEMDHGYVNPVTEKYAYAVIKKFDEHIWQKESGYNGKNVFNEYMTWAVFDLFNAEQFPEISDRMNLNWHFQNESRGFLYSELFTRKFISLYQAKKGKKKLKDLYPAMLEWSAGIQSSLSKPVLLNDWDTIRLEPGKNRIELRFSEPIQQIPEFDVVLKYGQWESQVLTISTKNNNLEWLDNGTRAVFETELPNKKEYYLLLNWWGVARPLRSKKDILVTPESGFVILGKTP